MAVAEGALRAHCSAVVCCAYVHDVDRAGADVAEALDGGIRRTATLNAGVVPGRLRDMPTAGLESHGARVEPDDDTASLEHDCADAAYKHLLRVDGSAGEPKHLRVRSSAVDKPCTNPRARRRVGTGQLPGRSELLRLGLSRARGRRERECDNDSQPELTRSARPRSSCTSLASWCSHDHRSS